MENDVIAYFVNNLNPVTFARDLKNDSLELWEDLIDWKEGTLPQDVRIGYKANSVFARLAGVLALGATITLGASLLISPLMLSYASRPLVAGIASLALLILGLIINPEMRSCGSHVIVNNKTGSYESTKIRLAWREYVIKRPGTAWTDKPYGYTAYTYFSTERDPSKKKTGSGLTLVFGHADAPAVTKDELCKDHRDFGFLPDHVMKYLGI